MTTVLMWIFAIIGMWCVLQWLWEQFGYGYSKQGVLEIVVSNGDAYVEGLLRLLGRRLKRYRSVSVIVYCVGCSDLTIDIVKRLHERNPWFSYYVVDSIDLHAPAKATGGKKENMNYRVELNEFKDPKEALRMVQAWLCQ